MKRFSLIISLAVGLSLLFGANAFAAWDVTIQSKTVSENETGVEVTVFGTWDLGLTSIAVPVVVREVDPGSFWTGALPYDTGGTGYWHPYQFNVSWGFTYVGAPWTSQLEELRPGVPVGPECDDQGDTGYDFVTPDHFVIAGVGGGNANPVETDLPFCVFIFDVTGTAGDFEFDTACFTASLGTIYMIDDAYPPLDHGPTGTGEATFNKGIITIAPNACPHAWGSYSDQVGTEGDLLQAAISPGYDDSPENDPANYYLVSGPGQVDLTTGLWTWQTGACDASGLTYTVEVEITDAAHGEGFCAGSVSSTTSFFVNVGGIYPTIDNCQDFTTHWTGTVYHTFTASGWGPFQWAGDGDVFSYTPGCDLGVHPFSTTVTDACGRDDVCDFEVTVTNDEPVCAVPDAGFMFNIGYSLTLNTVISDPNGDPLSFSNFTVTPAPPDPTAVPTLAGGVVTWPVMTNEQGEDNQGTYTLCVDATDGCETVNCCWEVEVQFERDYKLSVFNPWWFDDLNDNGVWNAGEKTVYEYFELGEYLPLEAHYTNSLNGREVTVGVAMQFGFTQGTGGFDLLLCYDQSVMSLVNVKQADELKIDWNNNGYLVGPLENLDFDFGDWEYFTYRTGALGQNCGSGCPSGYLRLIAIRDMNNGIPAPANTLKIDGPIAFLTFYVTEDRSFLNLCARIGFCSIDCDDNVISDESGNFIALGRAIQPVNGLTIGPDYDLAVCLAGVPDKGQPIEKILFDPGYICIVPPTDDRGDINLNGIANEIGDAVLFTNYFIEGPDVWDDVYEEAQILATDINNDGIVTTVADLVYLIRIITGDAIPYGEDGESAKVNPYANAMDVNAEMVDGNMVITTSSSADLGAGRLVFRYTGLTVGAPVTNTGMDVKSKAVNGELRVLVYSMENNSIDAGVTQFVTIPVEGNGTLELVESQFSDASGSLMAVDMHRVALPTAFELMQNYPNPFNANTQIRFALPVASNWSLNIYNVAGQVVETFNGSSEAGVVSVNWNADVASGIYFYKLTADNFTATKKMVLMK